jgi:hypothetical protein
VSVSVRPREHPPRGTGATEAHLTRQEMAQLCKHSGMHYDLADTTAARASRTRWWCSSTRSAMPA